jgi:methenyltetrahydrofolate cyclohydrolase
MDGFLETLASGAASPGAGAAAAVTAATATGLLAMFARSSSGLPDGDELASRADELRRAALEVIDDDRAAYARVLAHRPRRQTDAAGFRRVVAAANEPPLAITRIALATVEAGVGVVDAGSSAVRADLTAGLILAGAAAASATELIAANTALGGLDGHDLQTARHRRERIRGLLDGVVDG